MGCDLCVYLPDDGDKDCGMSYSTFDRVRTSIVMLYLKKKGLDDQVVITENSALANIFGVMPKPSYESVSKILGSIGTDEGDSMKFFWEHSDCDGSYWYEDCLNIANVIKSILPMFDEEDFDKGYAEALERTFRYAGEMEGIVEVC